MYALYIPLYSLPIYRSTDLFYLFTQIKSFWQILKMSLFGISVWHRKATRFQNSQEPLKHSAHRSPPMTLFHVCLSAKQHSQKLSAKCLFCKSQQWADYTFTSNWDDYFSGMKTRGSKLLPRGIFFYPHRQRTQCFIKADVHRHTSTVN